MFKNITRSVSSLINNINENENFFVGAMLTMGAAALLILGAIP